MSCRKGTHSLGLVEFWWPLKRLSQKRESFIVDNKSRSTVEVFGIIAPAKRGLTVIAAQNHEKRPGVEEFHPQRSIADLFGGKSETDFVGTQH